MEKSYWDEKWTTGDIRFHRTDVHPHLINYGAFPKGKILFPLCGKSQDLIWAKDQGHEVLGIEFNELAVQSFFQENQIPFTQKDQLYKGGGIEIWCGDFFKAPDQLWKGVRTIYDRAALVALDESERERYAERICRQGSSQPLQMLLITWEYPADSATPPPYSVDEAEVRELFEGTFEVDQLFLGRDPYMDKHPKFQEIGGKEGVYWIKS